MAVVNQVEEEAALDGEFIAATLVVNDYPHGARIKVTNKDFLASMADIYNCHISVRGVLTEKGRKPPLG